MAGRSVGRPSVRLHVWWLRHRHAVIRIFESHTNIQIIRYISRIVLLVAMHPLTHASMAKHASLLRRVMMLHITDDATRVSLLEVLRRLASTQPRRLRTSVPKLLHEMNHGDHGTPLMIPIILSVIVFDYNANDSQHLLERHRLELALVATRTLKLGGPYHMALTLMRLLLQTDNYDAVISANLHTAMIDTMDRLPSTLAVVREVFLIARYLRDRCEPTWKTICQRLTQQPQLAVHCAVCMEDVDDACSLRCGHAFCWACLRGVVSSRLDGTDCTLDMQQPSCPLCRNELSCTEVLRVV